MSLRTAEIELYVDGPALERLPAVERHLVQARKAFDEARRAIEQIAPLDVLPPATDRLRGRFAFVRGSTGVADALYVCLMDSTGAFLWTQLA